MSSITHQLRAKTAEYSTLKKLTVLIATWNVGNNQPRDLSWLKPGCDLVVIGFQEYDSNKLVRSPSLSSMSSLDEHNFLDTISSVLGDEYLFIGSQQHVGIALFVFSLKGTEYSHAETAAVSCSIFRYKGGVAMRLKIHDSWLCFVNSHLACDMNNFDLRNEDFLDISRRLAFKSTLFSVDQESTVFWFGDLNYRIDLSRETVVKILNSLEQDTNNLKTAAALSLLLHRDQLCRMMLHREENETAFLGFREPKITFMPTYKFDVNTSIFDTSKKQRVPAWCDRILWKCCNQCKDGSPPNCFVEPVTYTSHPEVIQSDHKPVSAVFKINVWCADQEKKSIVNANLLRELDKIENNLIPIISIPEHVVAFGALGYADQKSTPFTLINTGSTLAYWHFVPPKTITWASVLPLSGRLIPGESITVTFFANRTAQTVSKTNAEVFVLNVSMGKDYFITVDADFSETFLGKPLERALPSQVIMLTDYLLNGTNTVQYFKASGDSSKFNERVIDLVRNLDNNVSLGNDLFDAAAGALVCFLQALPGFIISSPLVTLFFEDTLQAISDLPAENRTLLLHIVEFCAKIGKTKKALSYLSQILGPLIVQGPKSVKIFRRIIQTTISSFDHLK